MAMTPSLVELTFYLKLCLIKIMAKAKKKSVSSNHKKEVKVELTFNKRTLLIAGAVLLCIFIILLIWRGTSNIQNSATPEMRDNTCTSDVEGDRNGNPGDYKNSYCDTTQGFCVDVHYQNDCSDDYRVRPAKACTTDTECHRWRVSCFTHERCGNGTRDPDRWNCKGGSRSNCEVGLCDSTANGVSGNEIVPDTETCQDKNLAIGEPIPDTLEIPISSVNQKE